MAKKKKKKAKKILCDKCNGLCCRYFALPIETPEDKEDYDDIRWYLCHEDITVFVEDKDWYVNIKNKCTHLLGKDYKIVNRHLRRKKISCSFYRRNLHFRISQKTVFIQQ